MSWRRWGVDATPGGGLAWLLGQRVGKPVTVSFVGMVAQDGENYLDSHGIPEIEYPERAVFAMHALMERMRFLEREGSM